MDLAICLLFFPGSRPELAPKAAESGAEMVCADLEDAVGPEDKPRAREAVLDLVLEAEGPSKLAVRINHPGSPAGREDLAALAGLPAGVRPPVLVPKVSASSDLRAVAEVLGRARGSRGGAGEDGPSVGTEGHPCRLIPVIETARGLNNVEAIAEEEGVAGLLFGALDLGTELGCDRSWESLLYARSRCVAAAALAGVPILDTPHFDLDDREGLEEEARRARGLGFTGKAAIHPRQVPSIHHAFRPGREELEHARRVVEAAESAGGGVFLLDGSMVDAPVVEAAHRIIRRAGESSS